MLDILSVLSNESRAELYKFLPQLWNNLCADKVLNGSFAVGIRVDVYVELARVSWALHRAHGGRGDVQHTRFLLCRELPQEL